MDRQVQNGRVVILTALDIEHNAVLAHLQSIRQETYRGTVYEHGIFAEMKRRWEVCSTEIGMGNAGAAVEAQKAIVYFNPDILFFVGVAGGIKDVTIGDVVVADKIHGYEATKIKDGITFPRTTTGEASYLLVQRARAERRSNDWVRRIKNCGSLSEPQPHVRIGPIAAGEKVIADIRSDIYQYLSRNLSDTLAVEMEGRGLLQAAHHNNVEAIVIRGISDLLENKAEADKGGSQERAACHASAFAFEMLAKVDIPPSSSSGEIHKLDTAITVRPMSQLQNAQGVQGIEDRPFKIFLSYAQRDEALVEQFRSQLSVLTRNGRVSDWYAKGIVPGQTADEEAIRELNEAHIILLFVSASFPDSERQNIEIQRAMERSDAHEAVVIPVLLRPTALLQDAPFGKLRAIPKNQKPVTSWKDRNLAFAEIVEEIGKVIKNYRHY